MSEYGDLDGGNPVTDFISWGKDKIENSLFPNASTHASANTQPSSTTAPTVTPAPPENKSPSSPPITSANEAPPTHANSSVLTNRRLALETSIFPDANNSDHAAATSSTTPPGLPSITVADSVVNSTPVDGISGVHVGMFRNPHEGHGVLSPLKENAKAKTKTQEHEKENTEGHGKNTEDHVEQETEPEKNAEDTQKVSAKERVSSTKKKSRRRSPQSSITRLGWGETSWFFHRSKAYMIGLLLICLIIVLAYMLVKAFLSGTCRERRKTIFVYAIIEVAVIYVFSKLILPHLWFNKSNFTGKKALERRLWDLDAVDEIQRKELRDPRFKNTLEENERLKAQIEEREKQDAFKAAVDMAVKQNEAKKYPINVPLSPRQRNDYDRYMAKMYEEGDYQSSSRQNNDYDRYKAKMFEEGDYRSSARQNNEYDRYMAKTYGEKEYRSSEPHHKTIELSQNRQELKGFNHQ